MRSIEIFFDGGCHPANGMYGPGQKYGSYEIAIEDRSPLCRYRIEFGFGTCNEAEFDTLQLALQETLDILETEHLDPSFYRLSITTDSMILKNRMTGRNAIHKKAEWASASRRMFECASRCLDLTRRFESFSVEWKRREHNLARFGH